MSSKSLAALFLSLFFINFAEGAPSQQPVRWETQKLTPQSLPATKWIIFAPTKQQLEDGPRALALVASMLELEPAWHAVLVWPATPPSSLRQGHARAHVVGTADPELASLAVLAAAAKHESDDAGKSAAWVPVHVRRMVGYLYAVGQGARLIFDGDLAAVHTTPRALDTLAAPGPFAFFDTALNPYAYFGQPSLWPRGIASSVGRALTNITSRTDPALAANIGGDTFGPRIRQVLVDGHPDLDPLLVLTRVVPGQQALFNVTFAAKRVPPVLFGAAPGPVTSSGALFHHDAFWALPLPAGPAEVLRGVWAQRILRELLPGPLAGVSYHAPIAHRMPPTAVASASRADPELAALHLGIGVRVAAAVLAGWQPGRAATVRAAASSLAHALGQAHAWPAGHAAVVDAFHTDLAARGYVFPSPLHTSPTAAAAVHTNGTLRAVAVRLVVRASDPAARSLHEHAHAISAPRTPLSFAQHSWTAPLPPGPGDVAGLTATVSMRWGDAIVGEWSRLVEGSFDESPRHVLPPCTGPNRKAPAPPIPRILFVVNLHWSALINGAMLRSILTHVFTAYHNLPFDVVFVGPGSTRGGVLGNGIEEGGNRSWASLTAAAQRYPDYEGYFLVNDDMVLLQSHFAPHAFSWRWQYPFTVGTHTAACRPEDTWYWTAIACNQTTAAFKEMCEHEFRGECGGVDGVYQGQSDAFYVPRSLIGAWTRWSDAMLRHASFLELAVPTILNAIAPSLPCTPPPVYARSGPLPPLVLSLCTTWGLERRDFHNILLQERHEDHAVCVGYHPVKVASREVVAGAVSQYLHTRTAKACLTPPCTNRYVLDADGLLWRRLPPT
eukprot:m.154612 g.154612  ORF g.154612 m.154612 type:complete len:838 (+) comp15131_c0_seq3:414-2927(+)